VRYAALWVRLEYKNHFPAYLLNFHPAKNHDEKDEWEVMMHPGAKAGAKRRFTAKNIVYRMDEKAANCTVSLEIEPCADSRFDCVVPVSVYLF
jgi:hypothetical protein